MPLSKKRAHLLKQRKVLKILTIHKTIGYDGFLTIRSSQPIGIISSPSSSPRQSSPQLVRSFITKSFWRWWIRCIKIKIWTTIKNFRLRKHCPGYLCWASLLHPLCHREIYFDYDFSVILSSCCSQQGIHSTCLGKTDRFNFIIVSMIFFFSVC